MDNIRLLHEGIPELIGYEQVVLHGAKDDHYRGGNLQFRESQSKFIML